MAEGSAWLPAGTQPSLLSPASWHPTPRPCPWGGDFPSTKSKRSLGVSSWSSYLLQHNGCQSEFLFSSQQGEGFGAGKDQATAGKDRLPLTCATMHANPTHPCQAEGSNGFVLNLLSPKLRGLSGHPPSKYDALDDGGKSGDVQVAL